MATHLTDGDTRLTLWRRVREFAVPPAMIETATARRETGDWAGACAAAGFDIDLDLRALARDQGRDVRDRIRADLLRWHLPRIAPAGLLRPGLTMPLARYDSGRRPLHLVVRTPPAWAGAAQRVGLAVWDGTLGEPAARRHGSASSSTPPRRSATPNWAVPCWRWPPSPGPSAAAAT